MSAKTIGILAGMGPRSTAPFVDLVITECQKQYGAKDNQDFPHMMIYSLPTPIFVDRPVDHEEVAKAIETGLRRLEGTGVDFIAMPCNSAHAYYPRLAASIKVPLLNIINEACTNLQDFRQIAICATEITM